MYSDQLESVKFKLWSLKGLTAAMRRPLLFFFFSSVFLPLPLREREDGILIMVGCCNGVVCLLYNLHSGSESIYLWNPCIQKLMTLPSAAIIRPRCSSVLGFGVDPEGGLKVVPWKGERMDSDCVWLCWDLFTWHGDVEKDICCWGESLYDHFSSVSDFCPWSSALDWVQIDGRQCETELYNCVLQIQTWLPCWIWFSHPMSL